MNLKGFEMLYYTITQLNRLQLQLESKEYLEIGFSSISHLFFKKNSQNHLKNDFGCS